MTAVQRVTVVDSQTGVILWTHDFQTRTAAMKYIKAAVRTNTKATVKKIKGESQ